MIAVSTLDGKLVRLLENKNVQKSTSFGFHPLFGFLSQSALASRIRSRHAKGLKATADWKCEFASDATGFRAISNCEIKKRENNQWALITEFGQFVLSEIQDAAQASGLMGWQDRIPQTARKQDRYAFEKSLGVAVLFVLALILFLPKSGHIEEPLVISEPVEVKLQKEVQKSVQVSTHELALPSHLAKQMPDQKAKVAVAQNLGFLSMLGRKDLTKALGGMPTVQGASAGAGAGGKQGSGGELLVGVGQGVSRTTVGNSGTAGLGGIGTKGAGGGGGGYGNSLVGSGNGRGLSSVPLSQDMILEGGLDRSVIQATIAKYLNQVRACYEEGLRKNPGLVGQVSILFEIGGSGAVNASNVGKSSLGNSEVEQCISARVLTWQFPKPKGGVNVKVNYPFMLRPVKS